MDWKHFRGPGFEMQVPTDWFITSSPQHQAIFVAPAQQNNMAASLIVDMQPVSEDFIMENARMLLRQIRRLMDSDSKIIQEEDTKLDGRPAYHCLYTFKQKNVNAPTLQRQFALVVDNMLVTLTASRTAGKAPELDQTLATMLSQFKFV